MYASPVGTYSSNPIIALRNRLVPIDQYTIIDNARISFGKKAVESVGTLWVTSFLDLFPPEQHGTPYAYAGRRYSCRHRHYISIGSYHKISAQGGAHGGGVSKATARQQRDHSPPHSNVIGLIRLCLRSTFLPYITHIEHVRGEQC